MNLIFLLLLACGEITTEQVDELSNVDDIPTPSTEVDPEDSLNEDVTVDYGFDDADSLSLIHI